MSTSVVAKNPQPSTAGISSPGPSTRAVRGYPTTNQVPIPSAPRLSPDSIRKQLRHLGITEQIVVHEQNYNQFLTEQGIQELGRGAEGTVYFLRGHVVKVINPGSSPAALREIAHMLYLNRIVQSGGMGERSRMDWPSLLWVYALSDGSISIGMKPFDIDENIPGATLYERLLCGPRIDRAYVLDMIRGICRSLVYAHRSGIIHHDLKPANIYVPSSRSQKPVIFDLGQALWQQSAWGRNWLRNEHNALYWYNGTYRYMHHPRRLAHLAAMAQAGQTSATDPQTRAFQVFTPTFYDDVFSFARILRDFITSRHTLLTLLDKAAIQLFYRRLMGLRAAPRKLQLPRPATQSNSLLKRISDVFRPSEVALPAVVIEHAETRYSSMEQVLPECERMLDELGRQPTH